MSDDENDTVPSPADLTIAEIKQGLEEGLWTIEEVVADELSTDHPRKGVLALAQQEDSTSETPGSDPGEEAPTPEDIVPDDVEVLEDPADDAVVPVDEPEDVDTVDEADDDADAADGDVERDDFIVSRAASTEGDDVVLEPVHDELPDHPLMTLPVQSRPFVEDPWGDLPMQSRPQD